MTASQLEENVYPGGETREETTRRVNEYYQAEGAERFETQPIPPSEMEDTKLDMARIIKAAEEKQQGKDV